MSHLTRLICATAVVSISGTLAAADIVNIGDQSWHRSEWRASTFAPSSQSEASLAVDKDGNVVVVWSSRRQQSGRYGVYAQRFSPDGVALGSETGLNLWTESHQLMPDAAMGLVRKSVETAEGITKTVTEAAPWLVWMSHGQDGHAGSIIARRFDGAFSGGSEILINQQWQGQQFDPVVVASPDGGALVAWTSAVAADEPTTIRARLLDAGGKPKGDEFGIDSDDGLRQSIPGAAFLADGTFSLVYAVFDPATGDPAGIRLARFDAAGKVVGDLINVSGELKNSQIEPVIASTANGFIVAWLDAESDGSDYGVIARRYDKEANALSEPFVVNSTIEGSQNAAAIAVAGDGRFAIAYNCPDSDKSGVFAQMFTADGERLGDEFRLTRETEGKQAMRQAAGTKRLAFSPDGRLLCAWSGNGGFGDKSSVNVTMLSPEAIELADKTQGVTAEMAPASTSTAVALAEGPGPHIPPTFDPKTIAGGAPREVISGKGEIGFTGVESTGWTPPDPHLAVGPDHVVVMTNGEISFFTKDGTRTFQDEIEDYFGFWGELGTTGFVFDPEVLYDEMSGRFFAMAAEAYAPGNKSYALVAVSDDSDPNGDWHKYRFDTSVQSGDMFDSPNMGVDAAVLYITGDAFGLGAKYPVYTFDKASLLAGNPPAMTGETVLSTSTQSAGIPPVSYDNPPALYMCEHKEDSSNTSVRMIALQDPFGAMKFTTTDVTVPAYGWPENPPQKGTSSKPNTFDARFWCVAYRNGSLWATHHINSDRVLARWYEFAMNGWPDSGQQPSLAQSGEIDPGSGIRTFFCSITVDDNGNAAMCYARSSPSEYISMETSLRMKTDPLGTFRPGVIWKAATGPYSNGRWGDYSQINVAPNDGMFWAHHEWSSGGTWYTWIQGFSPDFAPADLNQDGSVDVLDLLILLADWGPCPDCPADLDGNGVVDVLDLLELLSQWG